MPVIMKSVVCVAFILISFVTLSFASTSRGQFKDPRHPGKCTINENLILSPGQLVKDPSVDCGRIICGEDSIAEMQTCGVQFVHGCQLGDYLDKSLPYPDCCKRKIICNN